ncbi:MAG: amidohydrolase [Hyphomicrobiaceae bacterium]|nr:amidohydrolase [Hyphomicrobiaceae bacterium]
MSQIMNAIDCDVHPTMPGLKTLLPYMPEHWRETLVQRGMHELDSISYPNNSPLTVRKDWRPETGRAAATVQQVQDQLLEPFGLRAAILNCLYGVQLPFSEDMAAIYARAVNDWIKAEWLDRDPRLRASIVVPIQSAELAVEEIERCAGDKRFVQVLLLVMGETPLGRRHHWPIYRAAQRHGLAIGIHAGSSYRHPPTPVGWPSTSAEDYVNQSIAFQSQLASLLAEGVFKEFPDLKFVLLESGVSWLPSFLWRFTKYWRGLTMEIPWIDRLPGEIVRNQVRFSLQPFDGPPTAEAMETLFEHLQSDDLILFSTDYPHWQFEGTKALPDGLPAHLVKKITQDNPLGTYARLREDTP